mgnify:CR=1 FL=1
MGIEIEVGSLDELCGLMCDNFVLEGRIVHDYAETLRRNDTGDPDGDPEGTAGNSDKETDDGYSGQFGL